MNNNDDYVAWVIIIAYIIGLVWMCWPRMPEQSGDEAEDHNGGA